MFANDDVAAGRDPAIAKEWNFFAITYDSGCATFMKLADVIRFTKTFKMNDAQRFAQHVVPEVVRPARVIWNQAIGGIFLLFAVVFLGNGFNYYRQQNVVALGFSLFMGLVMGFFSIASFLQARKIARRVSRRT